MFPWYSIYLRNVSAVVVKWQLTLNSDTLHRHELSHHTLGPEGGKDRTHRITVKTFRACFKCAVARVRCSGGTPCIRCENRSLECQYPTERRSKAKTRRELSRNSNTIDDTPHEQDSRHDRSSSAGNVDARLTQTGGKPSPPIPGYQLGQFQVQLSGQNSSETISSSRETLREQSSDLQGSRPASEPNNFSLSNGNGAIDFTRLPFDQYAGVNLQQLYPHMPTSDIRATLANDQGTRFHHQFQPELADSNIGIDMAVAHNQQLQLGFTQPYLDQSVASTINWLSNDLLLDTTSDRSIGNRLPSHLLQGKTLDSSLAQTSWFPPVVNTEQASPSLPKNDYQTPSRNTSLGTDLDSPGRYSRDVVQSSTSQTRQCNTSQRPADSYIDSGGARLPRNRRKQDPGPRPSAVLIDIRAQLQQTDAQPRFSFPINQEPREETMPQEVVINCQIDPPTYDSLYKAFLQLCCSGNFLYPEFETRNFPSVEIMSRCVRLYFNSFQTIYPILHSPTFNPNTCHWLVTLAISAIGCHSAGFDEQDDCAAAFHELLRRAINVEVWGNQARLVKGRH
jgi:uncharacterized Zn finger protein (UPF0148 family)